MHATLKIKYHWPLMYSDVHQWTKSCLECQQGKTSLKNRAPLRSSEVQANVFDLFHFDHLQSESDGYHYVLVVIDSFSLFSVLLPAKTTMAEETARLLYENIFTVYTCESPLCDRAAAFRSQLIKEWCRLMNIKQVFTSARHPETNSRCESYNKNTLNALRTHCGHVVVTRIGQDFYLLLDIRLEPVWLKICNIHLFAWCLDLTPICQWTFCFVQIRGRCLLMYRVMWRQWSPSLKF